MNQTKALAGVWYLAALIPAALGVGIAVTRITGMLDKVAELPRVVVPGKGEVTLAAGDYAVFGETRSRYRGTSYLTSSLELRCQVTDAAGASLVLVQPTASEQYEVGEYAGHKMFSLAVPRGGTFEVACDGTGGPATLAFGDGLLWPLFAGIGGGVLGLLAGGGVFTFVFARRRKALRAATP